MRATSRLMSMSRERAERYLRSMNSRDNNVRLDNVLFEYGFISSRKEARRFAKTHDIRDIENNARFESSADHVSPDKILIDGEKLNYANIPLHFVLNKPAGFISDFVFDRVDSLVDLLPREFLLRKPSIEVVSPTDVQTSGMLILSQSHDFTKLIQGRHTSSQTDYLVSLAEPLRGSEALIFAQGGILLADGSTTLPAILKPHKVHKNICKVTLFGERKHQLRRMFTALRHSVVGVSRIGQNGLMLAPLNIDIGEWKFLSDEEILTVLSEPQMKREELLEFALSELEK